MNTDEELLRYIESGKLFADYVSNGDAQHGRHQDDVQGDTYANALLRMTEKMQKEPKAAEEQAPEEQK